MSGIKDFIEAYAMKRGISKVQAEQEVKAFLDVMKDKLKAGGVSLRVSSQSRKLLRKVVLVSVMVVNTLQKIRTA